MKVKLGDFMKAPKVAVKPAKKEKNQIQNMFKVLQPDEGDDDSAEEVLYIRSVEDLEKNTDGGDVKKKQKTKTKCAKEKCQKKI